YAGLRRLAEQYIAEKQWEEAKQPLGNKVELFPQDGGPGNPYRRLARVHRELQENSAERKVLEKLAELSADDVEMPARLCELAVEAKDWEAARKYALRWLGVNPLVAEPHRRAAEA